MKTNKKVNLFVIGAMKSGSTTLHHYLSEHPEIFMSDPKEPWYFVKEKNWCKGEEWYHSLFNTAPVNVKVLGESSADYTMMPKFQGVPERIYAYNPNARFIYVLRDPVKRCISHYWHNVRWHGEQRDMLTAVREDPDLVNFSNYYLQLSTYLHYFPIERFFILSFEEMVLKPEFIMYKIFSWLGVDCNYSPPSMGQAKNVTPKTIEMVRGLGVLNKFRYTNAWNKTHTYFPSIVKKIGLKFAVRDISRKNQQVEKVIEFLQPKFREQIVLLQSMLNRSFHEWDYF